MKSSLKIFLVISSLITSSQLAGQNCLFTIVDSIKLTSINANLNADFVQSFALTDSAGEILKITQKPLFAPQLAGNYRVYSINYKGRETVHNYAIGENINKVVGNCLDKSNISFSVCPISTNCNALNGSISLSNRNFNNSPDFQQAYALTDSDGIILAIKSQPVSTQPLFSSLSKGVYKVYGINYNRAEGISNFNRGQPINTVTGVCMEKIGPLTYQVCEEICGNGIDDDNNGKIDCFDRNCPEVCPCDLKISLSQPIYNDHHTPNNTQDDTFSFEATIEGAGTIGWEGGGQSGVYGTTTVFGPYKVDAIGAGFQIRDKINQVCFSSLSVNMSSCIYLKTCTCCSK